MENQVVWIIVAAVVGVAVLVAIGIYNGLIQQYAETRNGWAQIETQLKRRYDLIPNLVETVKGYASHEKDTFEKVIQARNAAMGAASQGPAAVGPAESNLQSALRPIFALAESYPELKANTNFLALQEELSSTENRIAFARQHYNDVSTNYNTKLMSFPTNLLAGIFGFKQSELFQLDPAEAAAAREAPKVKF